MRNRLEIGGYIEFEKNNMPMLHETALALNNGSNCLVYIIRAKKIRRIQIPYFLCDSIERICRAENVEVVYYHINEKFFPENISLEEDEWLYIVNFYGQLTQEYIESLKEKHVRVIVDQAQAYFQMPVQGVDTLYTCRKYFGVTDGAFLYTDTYLDRELETDVSYNRMNFLLGRFEKTASEFYGEYVANNQLLAKEPLKYMSRLTLNLLHGLDYERIRQQRTVNYTYLNENLKGYNKLVLNEVDGAFMYPFYHENATVIRQKMQQKKIYIPILWPNVLKTIGKSELEYSYAKNILPLPCDHRYGVNEMKYIVDEIKKCIN